MTVPGGKFIFDAPEEVPAIWGDGERVGWSEGEPLLIVGPPGVGKTTLVKSLVMSSIDLPGASPDLLGLSVAPCDGPVLYLAGDRPRQIARSFRRGITLNACNRAYLDDHLIIHEGPLPKDLARDPDQIADLAVREGAKRVFVDSLKDFALGLSDDETGGAVNRAFQLTVAAGIDTCTTHHQRKAQDGNRKPTSLADVYGSGWITAGAGSVILLWGQPGDLIVELSHLKQPAADIGPLEVRHDHALGRSELIERPTVESVLAAAHGPVTAKEVAISVAGKADPDRNQVEKVRRQLEWLVEHEEVTRHQDGEARTSPITYLNKGVKPREASVQLPREASRSYTPPNETASRTATRSYTDGEDPAVSLKRDAPGGQREAVLATPEEEERIARVLELIEGGQAA